MHRRTFMKQAGASLLTASVAKGTASSYARIRGRTTASFSANWDAGNEAPVTCIWPIWLPSKRPWKLRLFAICGAWPGSNVRHK